MRYLLDTDHISVLQQQSGAEYVALSARVAQHPLTDLALSVVSFHEQVLGCHTYIARARSSPGLIRGYGLLARLLSDDVTVAVLPFDAPAAAVFDGFLAQRVRIGKMDLRVAAIIYVVPRPDFANAEPSGFPAGPRPAD